jgi:hypothetical protein
MVRVASWLESWRPASPSTHSGVIFEITQMKQESRRL